ncbi:hypothetical protein QF026_001898 [Streptomyces aurantiacus]|nr:hypothetical protein [Streptomyces aurantiacus]
MRLLRTKAPGGAQKTLRPEHNRSNDPVGLCVIVRADGRPMPDGHRCPGRAWAPPSGPRSGQRTWAANASYACSSKRTNLASATVVRVVRTVPTAMRAASSMGHP